MSNTDLISIAKIGKTIYLLRGEKLMLDRVPADFMFQLSVMAVNRHSL